MDGYSDKIQRLVQEKDRMLIGGGWVRSRSGGGFSTNDPATEEKICELPLAAGEDVELAVEAASGSSATWRKLDPLFFAACKIAAPLVAGNTVILKPAEQTSLSALEMGKYVQEIFPPGVVNIVTVDYGLTASIWTRDLSLAYRTAEQLEAGYIWINGSSRHFLGVPFGGYKQSGIGREESLKELLSYVQTKAVNTTL